MAATDATIRAGEGVKSKRLQFKRDVHHVLDALDELFLIVVVNQDLIDFVQQSIGEKRRVIIVAVNSITAIKTNRRKRVSTTASAS